MKVTLAVVAAHCCAYLLYLTFERHYRIVGRWLRPKFERALTPRDGELIAPLATHLLPGRAAPASASALGKMPENRGLVDVQELPQDAQSLSSGQER